MSKSEDALNLLDQDIVFWSKRYFIPGYDMEDLQQEARLKLWKKLENFSHLQGTGYRTWANRVIVNHFRDLLRHSQYNCRKAMVNYAEMPPNLIKQGSNLFELMDIVAERPEILDFLKENNWTLEDFL